MRAPQKLARYRACGGDGPCRGDDGKQVIPVIETSPHRYRRIGATHWPACKIAPTRPSLVRLSVKSGRFVVSAVSSADVCRNTARRVGRSRRIGEIGAVRPWALWLSDRLDLRSPPCAITGFCVFQAPMSPRWRIVGWRTADGSPESKRHKGLHAQPIAQTK